MPDLTLRPSASKPGCWRLELRDHGPAETTYDLIAVVSERMARAIEAAGPASWLFDDPDEHARKVQTKLKEEYGT